MDGLGLAPFCWSAQERILMTTAEIASLVQGELVGRSDLTVDSVQTLERALETQLAFWERRPGETTMPPTQAGCVIVDSSTEVDGPTVIRVGKPRNAIAKVMRAMLIEDRPSAGVDPTAWVHPDALVGESVSIGPHAVVEAGAAVGDMSVIGPQVYVGEGAVLGKRCRLGAGSKVHGNARLGDRVTLHSGAVIGADGFGLVLESDHYENFPQTGGVEIADDVEIGANSCVDRGALDATRIGTGTKLDNLVHIGHNCQVGRHVVMAAQVGLSGSVVVEDYAVLGGQAGIGDRARIGARAQLGGQVGLLPDKKLAPAGAYWGTPARPLRQQLEGQANVNRLPRLFEEVKRLRERVEELEAS